MSFGAAILPEWCCHLTRNGAALAPVYCCKMAHNIHLAFNGFFALVVTGIAGVDHGSHGGHLSFYIIERWSVLSKHCFV